VAWGNAGTARVKIKKQKKKWVLCDPQTAGVVDAVI